MTTKEIDLPEDLFQLEPDPTLPSPLEVFLKRKRDPEGKLIPRKEKKKTIAASTFGRTIVETQAMIDTRNWEGVSSRHLVALYDLMHKKTYGIEAMLSPTDRYTATLRMGALVKNTFGGDFTKALDYFRWVWTREISREKWRRENNRVDAGRLAIWATMGGGIVTDYRLAVVRRRTA